MQSQDSEKGQLWGIVLAAGEGTRMRQFIQYRYRRRSPKQYIAFMGKKSMLQDTLHRVEKLIPRERTLIVVNPRHGREIKVQLSGRPRNTLIFQPYNRETAPGVLLPLIHIVQSDPEARVAIFPSDHFIREEDQFMGYVEQANRVVRCLPGEIVLLGVQPEGPEVEYGWIEPTEPLQEEFGPDVRRVGRFLEKPDPASALEFFMKGYLWNTFVSVTKAKTLIEAAEKYLPPIWSRFERMLAALGTDREFSTIEREYRDMEAVTLSRGFFEKNLKNIAVVAVRNILWSDWGSGDRVLTTLKRIGRLPIPAKGGIAMKVPKSNHIITIQGESHKSTIFRTNHKPLTAREREVLRLVAEGHKSKEIAQLLGTSVKTVETHRANIYNKLAFRNVVDLILYAIQNRVISVKI
ncbi:MAG: sugar phosphate nucleotidyltransferase (plasmid) [Candidatus Manganitrophus sp.]|nr:sugar phosphate nucleotidyltransferase [Candidatus Manganitrophus sp.]WDT77932.1 MAG: sugar phosphate nucleotidyltransferase [Candidatus Manganitrophus sp.]